MYNAEPFSYGTDEINILEERGLTQKEIYKVLHASGIYHNAIFINNRINKTLELKFDLSENIEFSIIPEDIIKLLTLPHPRAKAFYNWIISSQENIEWYMKNNSNIKLVYLGIEILGSVFELEDEKYSDNGKDIFNYNGNTYFLESGIKKYLDLSGKRIPEWGKYLDYLPGNTDNKIDFLISVLGLKYSGFRNWLNLKYLEVNVSANYWSAKSKTNSMTIENNIIINKTEKTTVGYSLRCVNK